MQQLLAKILVTMPLALILASCFTTSSTKEQGEWLFYAEQPDGLQAVAADDLDHQIELANKRLAKNPTEATAYFNLSQLYLIKKDVVAAEKSCRQGLRYDLKSVLAKKILAQVFYHKHQLGMARIILATLSDADAQDSRVLNLKGLMALEDGNMDESVALLKQATVLNPNDIAAMMNLGILYFEYRQIAASAAQFEKILAINANDLAAKFHLATCYSVLGKVDEAEHLFEQVLSKDNHHAQTLYNLAFAHQKLLQPAAALDDLKAYLATEKGKKSDQEDVLALMNDLYAEIDKKGEELEQLKPKLSAEAEVKSSNSKTETLRPPVSGEINKLESELEL